MMIMQIHTLSLKAFCAPDEPAADTAEAGAAMVGEENEARANVDRFRNLEMSKSACEHA